MCKACILNRVPFNVIIIIIDRVWCLHLGLLKLFLNLRLDSNWSSRSNRSCWSSCSNFVFAKCIWEHWLYVSACNLTYRLHLLVRLCCRWMKNLWMGVFYYSSWRCSWCSSFSIILRLRGRIIRRVYIIILLNDLIMWNWLTGATTTSIPKCWWRQINVLKSLVHQFQVSCAKVNFVSGQQVYFLHHYSIFIDIE